jgi:hypothetical protein
MTVCILAAAALVTVVAAVRSTWSPCGLSMLSTITPLSERAKGHAYRSTAAWFIAGAGLGGATLGAVMALLAELLHGLGPSGTTLVTAALVAALVAAASDSGVAGVRLPVHRRQVNERWLDRYRPWVYGAGFGWQIGNGLTTYITSAALYLMIVLAALTADPVAAFSLGLGFGTMRGLAVLLTRRLTDPDALRAFHRRFTAAGPVAGRAVVVIELVASVVFAAALGWPVAAAVIAGAGLVSAAVAATRGRRALAR